MSFVPFEWVVRLLREASRVFLVLFFFAFLVFLFFILVAWFIEWREREGYIRGFYYI
jgi:cell division protein FtsX